MFEKPYRLDKYDKQIIKLLKENAKRSQDEIAKEIKLSRPTVQKRMKNLEENNVIKFIIRTNEKKIGKKLTAFLSIIVERARRVWDFTYNELKDRMNEFEILEIHHIAGQEDVLLKIQTRNIDSLEDTLIKISEIKGVARTRTMICLSSVEPEFDKPIRFEEEAEYEQTDILWHLT